MSKRTSSVLAALALFVGLVVGTAPQAAAATYKIQNHSWSVRSILVASSCSYGYLGGSMKWLSPGYGTNYYGKGFNVPSGRAKVYINGTYRYTAYGPVTRCTGSGNYRIVATY